MRGVFLDLATVDRGDLDLEALQGSLSEWRLQREILPRDLVEFIADAQVVVTNKILLDRRVLTATRQLKLICIAATGTNNVDLETAARRNITVCNARGYATASVVEHVFALILTLTRQLPRYQRAIAEGAWQNSTEFSLLDYSIRELSGLTIGIIGAGELGRSVAKVAQAFGMNALFAERRGAETRAGRTAFEEVLRKSDVISIHCPLTPDTLGLVGDSELAQMKPDALLIHTARGGIVDESALAKALGAGRLGGAAIDVLSEEPPTNGNPLLDLPLPNLIITPHIAWAGRQARQRLIHEITKNIHAFRSGQPRNVVN